MATADALVAKAGKFTRLSAAPQFLRFARMAAKLDAITDFASKGMAAEPGAKEMSDAQHAARAAANARMRRSRELRRKGLRFIGFRIRETEVEELVRRQLLAEADRGNSDAIETALGMLLDQLLVPKHESPAR